MEQILYVLDTSLQRVGLVDSYISIMWCKRYYELGAIDLEIDATKANIDLLQMGRFIIREDDDTVYRIEAMEIVTQDNNENVLHVGGIDSRKLLYQRIVAEPFKFDGRLDDYVARMVRENVTSPTIEARLISNLDYIPNPNIANTVSDDTQNANLGEKITEICKTNRIGWRMLIEGGRFRLELYRGVDMTDRITLSIENETLSSTKHVIDNTDMKNTVMVDGNNVIWMGEATGIDRRETYMNVSTSGSTLEQMAERRYQGMTELAKYPEKISFDGEIVPEVSRYKKEYSLGDIVLVLNEFGMSVKARITEIIETWDKDGYTIEPVLDFTEIDIPRVEPKFEAHLIHTLTGTESLPLRFDASEYPYGVMVEIVGAKGRRGSTGNNDDRIEVVDSKTIRYIGGGAPPGTVYGSGFGGRGVSMNFTVDGTTHNATVHGGAGGGDGAGGGGRVSQSEFLKYGYNAACYPYQPGDAGMGANGDKCVFDVFFSDHMEVTSLSVLEGKTGRAVPRVVQELEIIDLSETNGWFSWFFPTINNGGDSGDGNKGQQAEYDYGNNLGYAGDGASASIPKGSYCTLPGAKMMNGVNEQYTHGVKIYKWVNVNETF